MEATHFDIYQAGHAERALTTQAEFFTAHLNPTPGRDTPHP